MTKEQLTKLLTYEIFKELSTRVGVLDDIRGEILIQMESDVEKVIKTTLSEYEITK